MTNVSGVVQQLRKHRDRAAKEVQRLEAALAALDGSSYGKRTGRGTLSAAARTRITAARRARWPKGKSGQSGNVVSMPKKRTLSAAALKSIRAAQKKRWAAWRAKKAAQG